MATTLKTKVATRSMSIYLIACGHKKKFYRNSTKFKGTNIVYPDVFPTVDLLPNHKEFIQTWF